MRKKTFIPFGGAILVALVAALWSCVNGDYRLDKLDTDNIVLFGDSLAIPLGSTAEKTLGELVDEGEMGFITFDEGGVMSIRFDGGETIEVNTGATGNVAGSDISEELTLGAGDELGVSVDRTTDKFTETIDYPAINITGSPIPVTSMATYKTMLFDAPDEIREISGVRFEAGHNTVTFRFTGIPSNINTLGVRVYLDDQIKISSCSSPTFVSLPGNQYHNSFCVDVGEITVTVDRLDFSPAITPADGVGTFPFDCRIEGTVQLSSGSVAGGSIGVEIDFDDCNAAGADFAINTVSHTVDLSDNAQSITMSGIPSQIQTLSKIVFSGVQQFALKLEPVSILPATKSWASGKEPRTGNDFKITLPDFIKVRKSGTNDAPSNIIQLAGLDLSQINNLKYDLAAFDFNGSLTQPVITGGAMTVPLSYRVEGAVTIAGQEFVDVKGFSFGPKIAELAIYAPEVASITGTFDFTAVSGNSEVSLDGIDKVRETPTRFVFDNPELLLSVGLGYGNHLPAPLEAIVKLTPSGGAALNEVTLPLNTTDSLFNFALGSQGVTSIDGDGNRTPVQGSAGLNINDLFDPLPDNIKVEYRVELPAGEHTIDLTTVGNGDYKLRLGYAMPLRLASDFVIAYSDTVAFDMLEDDVVERLFHSAQSKMELGCEVTNAIPLQLEMVVIPCDENYALLGSVNVTPDAAHPGLIAAGAHSASPKTSTVAISLSGEKEQLKLLRNLIFRIVARPDGSAIGDLRRDDHVKLRAYGKLTGGVHLGKISE